jgi:hypothetical protein
MSTENQPSHWDLLATEIGAEVQSEASQQPRTAPPPPTKKRERAAAPRTAPADTNWGQIAGELGLEVPAEEPPPTRPVTAARTSVSSGDQATRLPREAAPRDAAQEGAGGGEPPRRDRERRDRGRPPRHDRGRGDRRRDEARLGNDRRDDSAVEESRGTRDAEEVRIDESEAEPTHDVRERVEHEPTDREPGEREDHGGRRRRRRRGRRGGRSEERDVRSRRGDGAGDRAAPAAESHEDFEAAGDDEEGIAFADEGDFADAAPPSAEAPSTVRERDRESGEGEPRRKRRRRRRGRNRAGDKRPAGEDRERAAAVANDDDDDEDEFDEVDRPASDSLRAVADEEQESSDDRDDDDEPIDRDSHRSITTWEDAVGLIIAGNMEARARNPSTGSSSRGRGGRGGHGRSGK